MVWCGGERGEQQQISKQADGRGKRFRSESDEGKKKKKGGSRQAATPPYLDSGAEGRKGQKAMKQAGTEEDSSPLFGGCC